MLTPLILNFNRGKDLGNKQFHLVISVMSVADIKKQNRFPHRMLSLVF